MAMTDDEFDDEVVEAITVEAIEVEPEIEPEADNLIETEPEVPPTPPPPKPRSRKAQKEPRKGSKMKVIIVVVVLVVAAVALAIMFMIEPTVNAINVHAAAQKDRLKIIVDLSTSGLSEITDDARLEIKYEGQSTYDGTIKISGNGAILDLAYEDFLVGNGDYDIYVYYGG